MLGNADRGAVAVEAVKLKDEGKGLAGPEGSAGKSGNALEKSKQSRIENKKVGET